MTIVEVDSLKSNCGEAKANKCNNHHNNSTCLRNLLISCKRNVFLRCFKHTLTIARLLDILLAYCLSNILKHLHFHSAILFSVNSTLSTSTTMADAALYLVIIYAPIQLVDIKINIAESVVFGAARSDRICGFLRRQRLIGDLTARLGVLHIT
jgi:hypothetical protein